MRWIWIVPAILASFAAAGLLAAKGGPGCAPLTKAEKTRVNRYVQKKYKLPDTLPLNLEESAVIEPACFRKLTFRSKDPARPFQVELFLSPDRRFLARELLDTTLDPVLEERRKAQELLAGLTQGDYPSMGRPNAPVTLTVFSDFQCPFCAASARILKYEVLPQEGANVRLVFRHFPLQRHAWARTAAQAAACAQDQGSHFFWALHDFLFERQQQVTPENIRQTLLDQTKRLARFDRTRFERCLTDNATARRIDRDLEFGMRHGIRGTPTLFVNGQKVGNPSDPVQIRSLIREFTQAASRTASAQR